MPDFSFPPWDQISPEAREFVKKLLEKNRQERPNLEEALQHKWFAEFTEIHAQRTGTQKDDNGLDNKFKTFTITDPTSKKITQDIDDIKKSQQ